MATTSNLNEAAVLPPTHHELIARLEAEGYSGQNLRTRPNLCDLLVVLQEEGFSVTPSGVNGKLTKGTIVVRWGTAYLGYSAHVTGKPECLIGYQFNPGVRSMMRNEIPESFSLEEFCAARGLSVEAFALNPEKGPGRPPKFPHSWPPQTPPPELIGRGL